MVTIGLTDHQARCLTALERFMSTHGRSPSLRELGALIERAPSNVHRVLYELRDRGRVRWDKGKPHSLALVTPGNGYTLSPALNALLEAHCATIGDAPVNVVEDAVRAFLDGSDELIDVGPIVAGRLDNKP